MDVYILTAKKAFVNSTIYIMKAKCQKSLLSVQSVKRLKKLMLSCDRASTMTLQPLNTDRFCPPPLGVSEWSGNWSGEGQKSSEPERSGERVAKYGAAGVERSRRSRSRSEAVIRSYRNRCGSGEEQVMEQE